jgi:hypothetical protein
MRWIFTPLDEEVRRLWYTLSFGKILQVLDFRCCRFYNHNQPKSTKYNLWPSLLEIFEKSEEIKCKIFVDFVLLTATYYPKFNHSFWRVIKGCIWKITLQLSFKNSYGFSFQKQTCLRDPLRGYDSQKLVFLFTVL